jgi:hypothetical protein
MRSLWRSVRFSPTRAEPEKRQKGSTVDLPRVSEKSTIARRAGAGRNDKSIYKSIWSMQLYHAIGGCASSRLHHGHCNLVPARCDP